MHHFLLRLLYLSVLGVCLGILGLPLLTYAQRVTEKDSIQTQDLEQVVITATRNEKAISETPIPISVISQAQIEQMGSMRLSEVLQEQTGLTLIQEHGQGIQLQGFDPDYTLILIDGEPLIGRTAGTLELSRISVGNIERIEIVKGASSSLYGSEALAGVINIITKTPKQTQVQANLRYGTNQTSDISLNFSTKKNKFGVSAFVNRFASGGYDFTPTTFGQTVEPFDSYTFQSKLQYDFSSKLKWSIAGRYFIENQQSNFDIGTAEYSDKISGTGSQQDYSIHSKLSWKIADKWQTQATLYYSGYQTESELYYQNDKQLYDESFFEQQFLRPEIQTLFIPNEKHVFTFGVGSISENVFATRYTDKKQLQNTYFFAQHEFFPTQKWNLTTGARFDIHSIYGSQFSPKLASFYQVSPKIRLSASAGMGFKTPDFRQLYLNFSNAVAGYSVFGTEELKNGIEQLDRAGQLAEILLPLNEIEDIQAETSYSLNVGLDYTISSKAKFKVNFFRNDVSNLIETQIVARKTNGQNVFSYRNLNSIFTQGIETELSYKLHPNINLSAGYQFLQAKDKDVLEQLDKGQIFRRNPNTLETERLTRSDYGGLMGRSNHMFNAKLFFTDKKRGITSSLRAIYRSKYGFGDRNGNLILDASNEYVKGYPTVHFSVGKHFWKDQLQIQMGVDNLLNYKDEIAIPSLAGRLLWLKLHLALSK